MTERFIENKFDHSPSRSQDEVFKDLRSDPNWLGPIAQTALQTGLCPESTTEAQVLAEIQNNQSLFFTALGLYLEIIDSGKTRLSENNGNGHK